MFLITNKKLAQINKVISKIMKDNQHDTDKKIHLCDTIHFVLRIYFLWIISIMNMNIVLSN